MLPETTKPLNSDSWSKEDWSAYAKWLELPDDEATREIYRQVVLEHFSLFNKHFPDFDPDEYHREIKFFTAKEANDDIKFRENEIMDWYVGEYDDFSEKRKEPGWLYQEMSKNLTTPFPPILIHSMHWPEWKNYGRPYQLVEGCHRVSYLRRMLSRGLIAPESSHKFVVLSPRTTSKLHEGNQHA